MKAVYIKLFRDLWKHRFQSLAIILIVACGVASQVVSFSLIRTLNAAMDRYYETSLFPDLFVQVDGLGIREAAQLHSVSSVSAVQSRLVVDARLATVSDPNDPATATLIGLPISEEAGINRLVGKQGAELNQLRPNEVLVSEVFAEARELEIGDELLLTIGGQKVSYRIGGVAISPEYLFQMRDGAGVPDHRRFAVIWMPYAALADATKMQGRINSILITLRNTSSTEIVTDRVKQILGTDKVIGIQTRDDQVSHRYTINGIRQLRAIAIVPPMIFLAVAGFLISIAVSRLIKTERENIAMQRAFGYSTFNVALRYFLYIGIIVLLGCGLGILLGIALTGQAIQIYGDVYRFPSMPLRISIGGLAFSIIAATTAGLLGGSASIWQMSQTPPAVGLRPEPPTRYRSYFEGWTDSKNQRPSLGPISRMIVRGMIRRPVRSTLGAAGIALGIAVMILGGYTQGAIDHVIDFEFFFTRRYELLVQFQNGAPRQAIEEIRRIPGVLRCEPFESGRFEVSSGTRHRTVTLMGLSEENGLLSPVSANLKPITFQGGLAMSQALADALDARPGTSIEVVPLGKADRSHDLRASALISDYAGLNAYLPLNGYQKWFSDRELVSGAMLQVDTNNMQSISESLNRRPKVQAVTIKSAALENFEKFNSRNLLLFRFFNILFSGVIGVGAVYSIASVSFLERQRDLALMRVLGYSKSETGRVLIGELFLMALPAIPLGCLAGFAFTGLATMMLNSETQRVPFLIYPSVIVDSILVSLISCTTAAAIILHRVGRMDFVAELKSKD
jgi:putative ABC transport system permease protein